ncbi:Sodium/hydrogen exchanger [Pseudomonas fluorescens]|uniref:Sodium/hydrogen exchanger n=1 Tax=Pseudomonas fluorescens TaxID=294 RepID=A0A379IKK3_PSEFL|nr:hypothetical protein HZ99_15675 [Pseudomonas fluorescens]SUD33926.1 Sodium/hydrogen exchanger [Pseudomonas fluorescens]
MCQHLFILKITLLHPPAFICLTPLLTYVNFRFIRLPPTIGVGVTALMFPLLPQGLSFIRYPGFEEPIQH